MRGSSPAVRFGRCCYQPFQSATERWSPRRFTGLRWGEVIGLCTDAVDLDAGVVQVIRTVVEVAGTTSFKQFPKSRAGQRSVPLPRWVTSMLREHIDTYPP